MAAIRVNYEILNSARKAIEGYCSHQSAQMSQADYAVKSMLGSAWNGLDEKEFALKWEGICGSDSQAAKFLNSLIEFGRLSAVCAKLYQTAQGSAINEALSTYRSIM